MRMEVNVGVCANRLNIQGSVLVLRILLPMCFFLARHTSGRQGSHPRFIALDHK